MHRFLVFLWLGLGGALLAWHWAYPDDSRWRIPGSNASLAWLALLLALYNGLRWWSQRSLPQTGFRRRRPRSHSSARAQGTPAPAVDLGKESSNPEDRSSPSSGQ